jgi:hypothetical protein
MPRACTVCGHENSREIDQLLTRSANSQTPGMSLSMISARFDCSTQSLSRHRRLHLSRRVLHALRITNETSSTDLIDGLVESLNDLALMRSNSLLNGQTALAIRASTEMRSTSEFLLGIGMTDTDMTRELKFGQHVARAVARAVQRAPEIVPMLAAELRAVGEGDAAEDLEIVAANAATSTQQLEQANDF